jgi:hypothetical protein
MVELSLTDDHLHLEVKGLDKLWAFKSQLDIPLRHIRDVRHDRLHDERFGELVVEVNDPLFAVEQIKARLG